MVEQLHLATLGHTDSFSVTEIPFLILMQILLGFESILSKIMREEFVKRIRHEREFTMKLILTAKSFDPKASSTVASTVSTFILLDVI